MKKKLVLIAIAIGVILTSLLVLNLVTNLELKTEVILKAPKEKVWEILTDTEKYSEWNPFIISVKGEMKHGAKITNVMVNGGKENTFDPVITIFEKHKEIEWLGSGLGGMFKGRHYFKLIETGNGEIKMIHGEKFSGLLSGLIIQMIGEDTLNNFKSMNKALKGECEKINGDRE
jgi:hypothetical protein